MEKLLASIRSWKTSTLSVVPILGALAIALGKIDLEQQEAIVDGVKVVFDAADSILNEVIGVISAVTGIGLLFAKDGDKSSQELGI